MKSKFNLNDWLAQKISLIIDSIKSHPYKLLIAIFLFFILKWLWGAEAGIFLGIFILFFLMKWDSRVFVFFGLIFLVTCPFLLMFEKEFVAEDMAVYAYYCLFLGVSLQLVEYWRENRQTRKK